ncbi:MAG: DNA recombination protein RmuC, partial [Clostridia bacterium]|nr:DNA recombination protein RmuC [Clostridia bacterium]
MLKYNKNETGVLYMEILAVILSGLSLIMTIVIFFLLKGKTQNSLTNDDIEKVRDASSKEISKVSGIITTGIENQNKHFIDIVNEKLENQSKTTKERLDVIDQKVSNSLNDIRRENGEKLNEIQKAVDEKLQKTLDERIKSSFENVVTQIGNVNKAIGEIRSIADDVGSLKNILSNVKTKGIAGEVILGSIIGEILTPDQYETNYATKVGSRDVVEFAIKIPSGDGYIFLPVDSKFPLETYNKLKDAYDNADKSLIEVAKKDLARQIKNEAKTISSKYIDVPNTTDFAIMFLPAESLYIEAIEMGLFEECQKEYRVNIAGPTTLSAIINALRLGFNSLEIQKRSGEVFKLLGAVKTEFEKFAEALSNAQRKIDLAGNELENLVGVRTRQMQKKLKGIGTLTSEEAKSIIDDEQD